MDKVQKRNINDILVKLQKPAVLLLLFAIVFVLAYSLVFMTSFYKLSLLSGDASLLATDMEKVGLTFEMFPEAAHATKASVLNPGVLVKVGLKMSYFTTIFSKNGGLQLFNHWIFNTSIIGLCITLLLFVYFAQKRKRYYVTNFVTYGLVFGFDLYVGFSMLTKLAKLKAEVASVDYNVINAYYISKATVGEPKLYDASNFDWVFVAGNIVAIILLVAVVLGLALVIAKAMYQIKNKPIDISEVKINE